MTQREGVAVSNAIALQAGLMYLAGKRRLSYLSVMKRIDPVILTTRRLILRPPRIADASAIARLCNDRSLSKWLGPVPYPYSAFEARKFLTRVLRRKPGEDALDPMIICLRSNPLIIVGCIGVHEGNKAFVLGYWIGRAYRKRGFVTEAARALVIAAFDHGAEVITADYKTGNAPSARVIRNLGFRRTGVRCTPSRYLGTKTPAIQNRLTREMWMAKTKRPRLPSS